MSAFKGIAISPKAMIHTRLKQMFIYIYIYISHVVIYPGLEKSDLGVQREMSFILISCLI